MKSFSIILLIAALGCLAASPSASSCYTQVSIAGVTPTGWTVEMAAPCEKKNNLATYKYNPQTICGTSNQSSNSGSTETQSINFTKAWMPRYMGGAWTSKPNPPPGANITVSGAPFGVSGSVNCGVSYDTLPRAFAAGAAFWAYDMGRAAHETAIHTPFNFGYWDPVDYWDPNPGQALIGMTQATFAANATSLCSNYDAASHWAYALNIIIWPDVRLVDLAIPKGGVEPDIEPHDGRAITDMNTLIGWGVANAHDAGFTMPAYTNPLNGTAFFENGLDPNAECQVLDRCDIFTFAGNPGDASTQMAAELALVPSVPHSRLYWLIDMQETPAEIATARTVAITQGLSGVSFFPNGVATCSTQWNAVISAALGIPTP